MHYKNKHFNEYTLFQYGLRSGHG